MNPVPAPDSPAPPAPEALLARVRVVLVETTHPGNIGAAARAMKTMGLGQLVLVRPWSFPHAEATARSSGAADVLERTRVCASLDEALAGTVLAAAVTARRRDLAYTPLNPRQAAAELLSEAVHGDVALVFGPEQSGLSNDDVMRCRAIVHVPANPDYSSLNLAAAVQVLCYEMRMGLAELATLPPARENPAADEDVERFHAHLEEVLLEVGAMDPRQPRMLQHRLRRLFGRARLEREEILILRGLFKAILKRVRGGPGGAGGS